MTQVQPVENTAQSEKWKVYPAYKDSGVEWLGMIPEHWEQTALKRYLSSLKDGTHGTFERLLEGIPLLSAKNIAEDRLEISDQESLISYSDYESIHRNGSLKLGDLLLTIVGTIGRAAIFNFAEPVAFQRSVAILRFRGKHNIRYSYYLTQSKYFQMHLLARAKQSAQSGVYLGDVGMIPALCPQLPEQHAIAVFLDCETARINALIAKKERLIELLREKRTAFISHAVTKGLDPTVKMKDSGVEWIGEIPEHWEVKRLKFIADVLNGVAKGRDLGEKDTLELPYLRVANVQDGYLDLSDIATITVGFDEVERYSLQAGDVLMNEGGDFDKLCRGYVWNNAIVPCLHQNHVFAVRPHSGINPYWITTVTQSSYAKHYFILKSKQSTNLASISSTNLKEFPVLMPPENEQNTILTYIENSTAKIDALITRIGEGIEKLKEYSTAVISAAVTGKIDVRGEVDNLEE